MNPSANKGIIAPGGAQRQIEKTVETVDFRTSAGQCQEYRPVQVIHEEHFPEANAASNTNGSVLTKAAASVVSTLQSAKDAISRK